MLKTKPFLCVDFGAGSVKVAEFAANEAGTLTLTQFGVRALGPEGYQESKREAAVVKVVQALLTENGIKSRAANVCAPGYQVFSKFVKLPQVDTSKVTQIIQYEAQQNVPYPLEEVVWDYQIMGTTPSGELEVLLVAIKSDVVEGLFRAGEASGLKLQLVDVSPAALCNAFRFNYGDLDGCTMLLDIGGKTSNLLFFEKGKVFARGINIGANAITTDFIAEAKVPYAKAEELKIVDGFVSLGGAYEEPENPQQAAIAKIARQVMTRLHIQVNQTIQFYRGQQGGSAPTRLYLAGGGSILPYTREFFAEKLSVEVDYFNPFRNIQIDPAVRVEELAKVAHGFGEVVGLGLRNLAQCPVELNLVPKSIRTRQEVERKKPYFIASALSLIAFVFAVGLLFGKLAGVKQESLDALNTELNPLQERVTQLEQQENLINSTKTELDALSGNLENRFFWPNALMQVKDVLVKVEAKYAERGRQVGVWIDTFGSPTAPPPTESEETENRPGGGASFYAMDPMLAIRYGLIPPAMADQYKRAMEQKAAGGAGADPFAAAPTGGGGSKPANTNLVTVTLKLRAVNLNKGGQSSANGELAFAVQDEFRNNGFFDADGTKLSDGLEQVDSNADTFGFGLTLQLKEPMKM